MATPRKQHVAVFAFPLGGHATPLFSLTTRLAAKAPNATFSFFSTPTSNAALSSPHPNLKLYDVWDGVPDDYVFLGRPQEDIELFMKATPGNFLEAFEGVAKEKGEVTCLFSDSFLWFVGQMAEEMGVPWVAFWASAACSLSAHVYTDVLRLTLGIGADAKNDEHLHIISGFSKVRVRDLPEGVVWGRLDSLFSRLLHCMAKESILAAAVAINTFEGLEPTILNDLRVKLHKCLPIGPLSLLCPPPPEQDPHACLTFLDRFQLNPPSVVYVSFGTVKNPPPDELKALAEGLEESGVPFLWSLKEKAKEGLPEGFMETTKERGLIVPWAPQAMVLGHGVVGAFVTHCGWNSVLESIAAGVPMIGRPMLGDQGINGRMVSNVWEVGLVLDGGLITKEGIVKSIELLLKKEEGKRQRKKIGELQKLAKDSVTDSGSSVENFNTLLGVMVPR